MKQQITPKAFSDWLKERHLKNCGQCRKEGKARLMDSDALASILFKEFYETKMETT